MHLIFCFCSSILVAGKFNSLIDIDFLKNYAERWASILDT